MIFVLEDGKCTEWKAWTVEDDTSSGLWTTERRTWEEHEKSCTRITRYSKACILSLCCCVCFSTLSFICSICCQWWYILSTISIILSSYFYPTKKQTTCADNQLLVPCIEAVGFIIIIRTMTDLFIVFHRCYTFFLNFLVLLTMVLVINLLILSIDVY